MWKFAVLSLLISGCAIGTQGFDRETAPRAHVDLDFTASADGARSIKQPAVDTAVPTVDRMARRVRFELGDAASAKLELCVTPEGKVSKAALLESSKLEAFDQALVRDAATWQFATLPGPEGLETCSATKIEYHPW